MYVILPHLIVKIYNKTFLHLFCWFGLPFESNYSHVIKEYEHAAIVFYTLPKFGQSYLGLELVAEKCYDASSPRVGS